VIMTVVTISASYGAGGSDIGPRVAERLGVPFIDRAVPVAVAQELEISIEEASAVEENAPSRLWSLFAAMAPLASGMTVPSAGGALSDERQLIEHTGRQIRTMADAGGCVIVGRAAAVVLADHADALHVRLDGARQGRIKAAMRQHGIDQDAAAAAQRENDKIRSGYVTRYFGVDSSSPSLYHLVLDTVRLGWKPTEDLIIDAARLLERTAAPDEAPTWRREHTSGDPGRGSTQVPGAR
jgi:cytidylate kinase